MKQGWEIAEFEKCLEKVTYTNKIQRKDFKEDGIYPIVSQEKDYINGYWDNEEDLFKVDKPVVIFGDHTQVIKFIDFDFVLGADGVKILKPKDKIDSKYFYYFLQNVDLGSLGYARHYRLLKEINIAYPKSLPEQQRIVSILDEAFAAIAKAKANAEQNLKNAKELFESVLNNLIIDDGKVKMEKLGDVCEIKGRIGYRGYTVQDLVQKGEGAITLSPSNIQDNKFITDKCTYISWFKYEESPEIMVFEGDILFVKTGSTYGKVALVENLPEKATINPQFVVLKDIKCSNRFLYYSLTTKAFKEKVENIVGGAATPTLSQTNLAEQTIPIPPLKAQQTIVRQLDALRAETQKLEALYQKKMDDLEELKKSILQKAFAGELKTEKSRRDDKLIENKMNRTKPNPEGVK